MDMSNTKRKKRKTRKCLDEIRKRSRSGSYSGNNIFPSLSGPEKNYEKPASILIKKMSNSNNCITTSRLTLAIFPKAVTSATITRPALAALRLEHNTNALFQNENNPPIKPPDINTQCSDREVSDSVKDSNNTNKNDSLINQWPFSDSENKNSIKSASINMLSPSSKTEEHDISDKTRITILCGSSSTSLSGQEAAQDEFHEHFINKIPYFLKENVPGLFQLNPVRKLREGLHRLLVKSCQEESRDNILQCIRSRTCTANLTSPTTVSASEGIVENPMKYLRFGNAWKQGMLQEENSSMSSSSAPSPTTHQPATPIAPSSPSINILEDTPEYQYYPHKLNQ